jgi:FkbH-like protein
MTTAQSPTAPAAIPAPGVELKPADYHRVARAIRAGTVEGGTASLRPLRVAVLGSYTMQFAEPYLVVEAARRGRALALHFGAFGQFEQELLDPASALYAFEPDLLVLALRPEDVDPEAVARFHATSGARFAALADQVIERLAGCVTRFRAHSRGAALVANFATPSTLPLGPFDANVGESLTYAFAGANVRLRERVAALPGAAVWDYAGLVRAAGDAAWSDPRLWALARVAVASPHQPRFAAHLVRSALGMIETPAKCLVLDLDNTIWGGVIGDDGMEGIHLGDDHPGSVFKAFQRRVLALRDRGILLAVVSKNDHDVAERCFREHPEMLIRWDDVAAARINWGPKSENLREIARELNIGLDALAFFDDNPVERAEVRANAPEVRVVEVPTDPLAYEAALAAFPDFDAPLLSGEDVARAEQYRVERERRKLETSAGSVEEFLRGLGMVAQVGLVGPTTLARVAQLIGKTNQFNLTTRRHSQADVAAMIDDPGARVAALRLADRFGDHGLVAVAIVRREGTDAVLDSFLMSCRVMNRKAEHALMSFVAGEARAMGCTRLVGEYVPTKKNGMVRAFYPDLGFASLATDGETTRWELPLGEDALPWPELIAREPLG